MYIIIIIRFFIPPFLLRFAEIVIPGSRTRCNQNVEQHVTSSACSTDDSMISIKWVTHESQVKIASPQKSHFKVISNHCSAVELRSSSSVTYLPSYGPRVPGNDWLEIIVHEIKTIGSYVRKSSFRCPGQVWRESRRGSVRPVHKYTVIVSCEKSCEIFHLMWKWNDQQALDKEKIWVSNRIRTYDLPNTGRALYPLELRRTHGERGHKLSYFANWSLTGIWWKRSLKTHIFQNALPSGNVLKRRFSVIVWT